MNHRNCNVSVYTIRVVIAVTSVAQDLYKNHGDLLLSTVKMHVNPATVIAIPTSVIMMRKWHVIDSHWTFMANMKVEEYAKTASTTQKASIVISVWKDIFVLMEYCPIIHMHATDADVIQHFLLVPVKMDQVFANVNQTFLEKTVKVVMWATMNTHIAFLAPVI